MSASISESTIHRLKNQLAIILGFCEVLLSEMPAGDHRRSDLEQIHRAGKAALEILRGTGGN